MSVFCPAMLLSAKWVAPTTRITCTQPLSRCSLTFLASFFSESVIVQELCESRGGRPGLSVLTSLLVSVDVKNY